MSVTAVELAAYTLAITLFSCFAGAIVGVGSVLLIAPLLYFGAPLLLGVSLDFKAITALTTFAVVVSAARSIFVYRGFGLIRREVNLPMAIPAFFGACLGVTLANIVSSQVVQTVFALASIAGALIILVPYNQAHDVMERDLRVNPLVIGVVGGGIGIVGGLAGAGGGFLLVPMLLWVVRLPTRIALGAAAMNGLIIAIVAFVGRIPTLGVDWTLLLAVGFGSFIGAGAGTHLQQRVPTLIIRRAFAVVVGISALRLLVSFG
jgi:uncharacterized protein